MTMDAEKRRQGIILIAAALAVLYGLYNFIAPGTGHKAAAPQMQAKELQLFVTQTTEEVTRHLPLPFDTYIFSRAESKWERNPFSWKAGFGNKGGAQEASLFTYTGFLELGNRRIAIINDMEYQAGDHLEKEGFFVRKISPASVVIKNRLENTEFEIPLAE